MRYFFTVCFTQNSKNERLYFGSLLLPLQVDLSANLFISDDGAKKCERIVRRQDKRLVIVHTVDPACYQRACSMIAFYK